MPLPDGMEAVFSAIWAGAFLVGAISGFKRENPKYFLYVAILAVSLSGLAVYQFDKARIITLADGKEQRSFILPLYKCATVESYWPGGDRRPRVQPQELRSELIEHPDCSHSALSATVLYIAISSIFSGAAGYLLGCLRKFVPPSVEKWLNLRKRVG